MRIRTIKPEFWMHEGLCKCSEFTRLLAIALLNWADDEGYFMANPVLIRGQVFPFLDDSKIIPRSLQDLSRVGWILIGKDDQDRDVGMVINFSKHQRVDKPKRSSIKGNSQFQEPSKMNLGCVQDESKEEWKGMEGKGMDLLSVCADEVGIFELEKLWLTFPPTSRNRSSRKKLAAAWRKTTHRPEMERLIESVDKWANCDQWTRDGGQYAQGAHIWLNDRKWEDDPIATVRIKSNGMTAAEMGLS